MLINSRILDKLKRILFVKSGMTFKVDFTLSLWLMLFDIFKIAKIWFAESWLYSPRKSFFRAKSLFCIPFFNSPSKIKLFIFSRSELEKIDADFELLVNVLGSNLFISTSMGLVTA